MLSSSRKISLHSLLALILSLSLFSIGAEASGSYNRDGAGGGSGYKTYGLGKDTYLNKIVCDTCPYPNKTFNKAGARELINKISRNDIENVPLYEKERSALIVYLKKRHKIW